MRMLIGFALTASASLAVSAASAPPNIKSIDESQIAAGRQPARKPVKYIPMAQGTKEDVPFGSIPVYYCTSEGLAQAKKEGPVLLGFDWAARYQGRIVGLSEKTVTIKPEGNLQCNAIRFNSDKTVRDERVYLQDNTEPPRVFKFTEHLRYCSGLRAAPPPGGLSPYRGHKIRELQMGDVVFIRCRRLWDGLDYCDQAEIHRRPGGRVPPLTGEDWISPERRSHVVFNAQQAREEKAVATVQRMMLRLRH